MHHSGYTPRQPAPFEIRCLRPTIPRSPGVAGAARFGGLSTSWTRGQILFAISWPVTPEIHRLLILGSQYSLQCTRLDPVVVVPIKDHVLRLTFYIPTHSSLYTAMPHYAMAKVVY